MTREVLDASVVISFFEGRAGTEQIEAMLMEAIAGRIELRMSVINWGEVYYSTWRASGLRVGREETHWEVARSAQAGGRVEDCGNAIDDD